MGDFFRVVVVSGGLSAFVLARNNVNGQRRKALNKRLVEQKKRAEQRLAGDER